MGDFQKKLFLSIYVQLVGQNHLLIDFYKKNKFPTLKYFDWVMVKLSSFDIIQPNCSNLGNQFLQNQLVDGSALICFIILQRNRSSQDY